MNDATLRLAIFLGLLALLIAAEYMVPQRARALPRTSRWRTNISVAFLNVVTLWIMGALLPVMAVGAALDAGAHGFGLLNHLSLPYAVEFMIALIALDFSIWAQHLITHKIPLLWRLHRVHHADRDMDVTTAVRFHPVEIALSMALKIGLIYALGPAALAVLTFEALLNGLAMFNHANIKLPPRVDAILRLFIVTPDMHLVHHSTDRAEHDSNYGFGLSIWDRLFGTYTARPRNGVRDMRIGLHWQDDRPSRLKWVLGLPFHKK
ncbi:hypothetical protein GCM10007939_13060 [Amylibacter marinus]|uniref:Fatty acid hydroxylase domain-containing protein n=1 Tax=Amylibacter marinus TaxID=1475483 RepID=A0ABQ5VVA5_9RHOB|nr:hypothetical protein GCM10007939_13060 [Amylibacter marinus]